MEGAEGEAIMSKKKKSLERVEGTFSSVPHRMMDSLSYSRLNFAAKCLLMELIRQLNGSNNGHLQLTSTWLRKRGWTSSETIHRATEELIRSGLVARTKQGGLNIGPSQFAVTWLPISNFIGLEMAPSDYRRMGFLLADPAPRIKSASSQARSSA
jgi:hypothetical protein